MDELKAALLGLGLACGIGLVAGIVHAHNGGMAADGCHKDNAVGERHWHVEDSIERGGECIEVDGETVQLQPFNMVECVMAVKVVEDELRHRDYLDSDDEVGLADILRAGCL